MSLLKCSDPYTGRELWTQPLVVYKCAGYDEIGKPCKKRIAKTHPYCQRCAKKILHVVVSPSSLGSKVGYGLIAHNPNLNEGDIVFRKGDYIAPYMGTKVTAKVLSKMYDCSEKIVVCPYAVTLGKDIIDGALYRGFAVYANDAAPEFDEDGELIDYDESKNNSIFQVDLMRKKDNAELIAIKDIKQNEEIFVSYSKDYWEYPRIKCELLEE